MILLRSIETLPVDRRSVVTMGNFDGVHSGHATLISEVVARARAIDGQAVMITFDPHTRNVLVPGTRQPILSTIEEKAVLVEKLGLDYLICLPFNDSIRDLSAAEFVEEILVRHLHTAVLAMGPDHTFGRERGGNSNSLRELLSRNDISAFTIALSGPENRAFSSTGIRGLVARGAMSEALVALGHPYLIRARRVSGLKIGTRMGFPTLNFETPGADKVLPPSGIYAGQIEFGGCVQNGALYFGNCPTFENRDVHFELHLLSTPGAIPEPDEYACLWVWKYVRGDQAFATEEALAGQIRLDIDHVSRFFLEERVHANH